MLGIGYKIVKDTNVNLFPREVLKVVTQMPGITAVVNKAVHFFKSCLEIAPDFADFAHVEIGGEGALYGLSQTDHQFHFRKIVRNALTRERRSKVIVANLSDDTVAILSAFEILAVPGPAFFIEPVKKEQFLDRRQEDLAVLL